MRFKSIASGSKGNCGYIEGNDYSFIIDVGINYQRIEKELEHKQLENLTGILISHCHSDHIKGLKQLVKKVKKKVFVPKDMKKEVSEYIEEEWIEIIESETVFGSLKVKLLPTSHDVNYSVGYLLEEEESSLVFITDTGYINKKILEKIVDKTMYYIESNHDEKMLMNGPYPYYLKQRVIGDTGHLSNKTTARYLQKIMGKNTKNIILAHISEKNNTKELALETAEKAIRESEFEIELLIAEQDEATEFIEV
ncbi:MAG: MBL fold metallo-hydrolase [Bacilli bacterium]|nr:MBL fold metallo-hydrolase [Bacilli bacterium]